MNDLHLFDLPKPIGTPPETKVKLSATRRLTARNNDQLARGIHPATLRRVITTGETCGGCDHHHAYDWHNGYYHKCDVHRLGESHSAASDIRVSWPACELFFPRDDTNTDKGPA